MATEGGKFPPSRATLWVLSAYVAMGTIGAGGAGLIGENPFKTRAWVDFGDGWAPAISTLLGGVIAAITILATRVMVRRAAWARALHADLRPVVRHAGDFTLFGMAAASGVAEELLFRGCLVPIAGIVASSLVFGVIHQVRGRARWGWMVWAALMGFVFALLFRLTGTLVGPITAHVIINLANLRLVRDTDPGPRRPRELGGLLGRA